jgi:hypothetical protein
VVTGERLVLEKRSDFGGFTKSPRSPRKQWSLKKTLKDFGGCVAPTLFQASRVKENKKFGESGCLGERFEIARFLIHQYIGVHQLSLVNTGEQIESLAA